MQIYARSSFPEEHSCILEWETRGLSTFPGDGWKPRWKPVGRLTYLRPTYDLLQQRVAYLRLHNQDLCVCKELLSNASFRSIYEVISQSVCTRKFQQRWIEQYCAAILKRRYVWTIYEFMSTKVSFFSFSFF